MGTRLLSPVLGSSPGIRAQDITLAAPLNVRDVSVFLMGSNRQLDFQNIGFTAEVFAPVPEPANGALMGMGLLGGLAFWQRPRASLSPRR